MIIKIYHKNELYEEITKSNACLIGASFSNASPKNSFLNLDELQSDKGYIFLKRPLPSGFSAVFLIYEISEELKEKYKNLTTFSVSFEDIKVESTV